MINTIKKAIAYRLIIMASQAIFLYVAYGDLKLATEVSLAFAALATLIHVVFERVWER